MTGTEFSRLLEVLQKVKQTAIAMPKDMTWGKVVNTGTPVELAAWHVMEAAGLVPN